MPYDHLVLAVGAKNNTFGVDGADEYTYFLKSTSLTLHTSTDAAPHKHAALGLSSRLHLTHSLTHSSTHGALLPLLLVLTRSAAYRVIISATLR